MDQYTNHSGGADGADKAWKDLGKPHGVKTIDWRPQHLPAIGRPERTIIVDAVKSAASALKRPSYFKGIELVERNWFPAYHATAVYAIGHIISPGEEDYKGFVNETSKEIVAGGTGWAVEMAIQMNKRIYVFDMSTNLWYWWREGTNRFEPTTEGAPILTKTFAGIGSRQLTPQGIEAIEEIYKKTFNHESRN